MKRTIIFIAAIAVCSDIAAQSNIEKLFRSTDSDRNTHTIRNIEKNNYEDDSNAPTTYCYMEKMVADKNEADNITGLFVKTFDEERQNAYYFYRKTEDSPNMSQIKISYGTDNEYAVNFGTHHNHNYLVALFHDKNTPTKRTAYAIVWYENGNDVEIIRYRIYGNDPNKQKPKRIIYHSNGTVEYNNDKFYTFNRQADQQTEQISNDIDFMKLFGTLRASLISAQDDMLRVGLVVKLVDLCKKHYDILSDNERDTCVKSIKPMMSDKSFNDPYISGMLNEAILTLQKK